MQYAKEFMCYDKYYDIENSCLKMDYSLEREFKAASFYDKASDDSGYKEYVLEDPMALEQFDKEIVKAVKGLKVNKGRPNDFLSFSFDYSQGGGVYFIQVAVDDDGKNYDLEIAHFKDLYDLRTSGSEHKYGNKTTGPRDSRANYGDPYDKTVRDEAYYEDGNRRYKLYLHEPYEETDFATVIRVLKQVVVGDTCPDLSNWRDITAICQK